MTSTEKIVNCILYGFHLFRNFRNFRKAGGGGGMYHIIPKE
ncbi:MAG: hypothetical protein ACI3ZD_04405 [Prevotella sp.]